MSVKSPTRNPRLRNQRDPNLHYVRVEKENRAFEESRLEEYLDESSPTDPSKPMYEVVSEDRKDTGSSRMVLIACSKEDYKAYEKDITARSRANERPTNNKAESDFTTVEHDGHILTAE